METKKQLSAPLIGILIAVVIIAINLIFYVFGSPDSKILQILGIVVFAGSIIAASIYYGKFHQGQCTYGACFVYGFKATAAATVILAIYTFVAIKFIMPEVVEKGIAEAQKNMSSKNMPPEQIEAGISMMRKYMVPMAVSGTLLMNMILGLICALIGAAIAPKNKIVHPETNL